MAIPAAGVPLNWNEARARMIQLGALSFRVDNLGTEGYRVIILLPTDQAQRLHQIEGTAGTEASALAAALDQAGRWAGRQ